MNVRIGNSRHTAIKVGWKDNGHHYLSVYRKIQSDRCPELFIFLFGRRVRVGASMTRHAKDAKWYVAEKITDPAEIVALKQALESE